MYLCECVCVHVSVRMWLIVYVCVCVRVCVCKSVYLISEKQSQKAIAYRRQNESSTVLRIVCELPNRINLVESNNL